MSLVETVDRISLLIQVAKKASAYVQDNNVEALTTLLLENSLDQNQSDTEKAKKKLQLLADMVEHSNSQLQLAQQAHAAARRSQPQQLVPEQCFVVPKYSVILAVGRFEKQPEYHQYKFSEVKLEGGCITTRARQSLSMSDLTGVSYLFNRTVRLGSDGDSWYLGFENDEQLEDFDYHLYQAFIVFRRRPHGRFFTLKQFQTQQPKEVKMTTAKPKIAFDNDKYIRDFKKNGSASVAPNGLSSSHITVSDHSYQTQGFQIPAVKKKEQLEDQTEKSLLVARVRSNSQSAEEKPVSAKEQSHLPTLQKKQQTFAKQVEEKRPAEHRISELTQEELIEVFKKGFVMLKYAKGSSKPKPKQVYLSQDEKSILWKDLVKKDVKSMPAAEVLSVALGRNSPGFKKEDGAKPKPELVERSVWLRSRKRVLELQAERDRDRTMLLVCLNALVSKYNLTVEVPIEDDQEPE